MCFVFFGYVIIFVDDVFVGKERIDKFISKDAIDNLSISDDVGKLIMDVYNCEFNAKELFSIAENIFFLKDYLQCALETIELQLEAYYNGDKAPNFPDKSDYEFINSDYDSHSDFLSDKYLRFQRATRSKISYPPNCPYPS